MRNWVLLISVLFLSFWGIGCQEPVEIAEETVSTKKIDDHRKKLQGFEWLKTSKNYAQDKNAYLDTFNKYYNRALEEKKYDTAAAYLSAYGDSRILAFDSIYFNLTEEFFSTNKEHLNNESKSFLTYNLGKQSFYKGDLEKSNFWLNKAINYPSESALHRQIQGFSNFSLAQNFSNLRNYESSEMHLIAADKIFVEVGDVKNQGTVNLLLHDIYMQSSLYEQAEATLQKGLDILKSQNTDFLTFSAYGLFVHLRVAEADTQGAIDYIDSLVDFSKNYEDIQLYHQAILNQLISFKYISLGDIDSADKYLKLSNIYTDSAGNPDLYMRTHFQEIFYAEKFQKTLKNPQIIESYYKKLASEEIPNRQYLAQLATALYRYYSEKGDYKKANEYGHFLIRDISKRNDDRAKGKLFEVEKKYKSELKENIILQQQKKLDARNKTIIILIGSVILIILLFLIYTIWNKNKAILKEKQNAQNFTSQLLKKSEDDRKRIASDLHDSVSNELVNLRHSIDANNSDVKYKIDFILDEVRNISRNLSPTLFDRIGLELSIEQLIERTQNNHDFFITSSIDYSGSLSTEKELQLYRIIQEAITNILKHAEAHAGKITISEIGDNIEIEIKDNGKGFDVERMLEKGNCFGLLNITERAKYMDGKVKIKSNSYGTVVHITIPKTKK